MLIKPSIFAVIAASALLASQDVGTSIQDYRMPDPSEHSAPDGTVVDGHHPPHYELIYRGEWPDRIRHEIRCYDNFYVIHYRRYFDDEGTNPLLSLTHNGNHVPDLIDKFASLEQVIRVTARCNGPNKVDQLFFTAWKEQAIWDAYLTFDQGKLVRSTMRKRDD